MIGASRSAGKPDHPDHLIAFDPDVVERPEHVVEPVLLMAVEHAGASARADVEASGVEDFHERAAGIGPFDRRRRRDHRLDRQSSRIERGGRGAASLVFSSEPSSRFNNALSICALRIRLLNDIARARGHVGH